MLYCNIIGPSSYMRSVVDRNVVMRRIPVHSYPTTRLHTPRGSKLHDRRGDKITSATRVTFISFWWQIRLWSGEDWRWRMHKHTSQSSAPWHNCMYSPGTRAIPCWFPACWINSLISYSRQGRDINRLTDMHHIGTQSTGLGQYSDCRSGGTRFTSPSRKRTT